nr:uncharacterized protein LOC121115100 [Lepeophtheirus salmonis]
MTELDWSNKNVDIAFPYKNSYLLLPKNLVQPKGGCPEVTGWMKGPMEHCFNIPEKDYNIQFEYANKECENLQGVLAGIHSHSDNQWLLKNIPKNKQKEEHWFGAYKAGVETDSSFHWIDLEPSLGGYVNWDSSNRNNMTGYGAFNGTSGKWRLISDDTQLRSFCVVLEKLYQHHLQNP